MVTKDTSNNNRSLNAISMIDHILWSNHINSAVKNYSVIADAINPDNLIKEKSDINFGYVEGTQCKYYGMVESLWNSGVLKDNMKVIDLGGGLGIPYTESETPIDFKDMMVGFDKFDVIFVATTADTFLIRFKKIEKIMKNKKKGTLIMDLSEPRTVDEQIATIKGIKLVNPAQINEMIAENTKKRLNAVSSIEEKIDEEVPIIEATLKRISGESLVNAS